MRSSALFIALIYVLNGIAEWSQWLLDARNDAKKDTSQIFHAYIIWLCLTLAIELMKLKFAQDLAEPAHNRREKARATRTGKRK